MTIKEFIRESSTATQNDLTSVGIGGFTAMARVDEGTSYKSQVPTTYLEDGSFVQDHIINEPIKLTISGVIADISTAPVSVDPPFAKGVNPLEGIAKLYAPKFSPAAQKLRDEVFAKSKKIREARELAAQAQTLNIYGGVTNQLGKSLREQFVDAMEAIHHSRQLISIDMPYRTHKNMCIVDLQITKNNKEELLSFRLTATEVLFAEVQHTKVQQIIKKPMKGAGSAGTGGAVDKGKQTGEKVSQEKVDSLWKSQTR